MLRNTPIFTRREFMQTLAIAGLGASLPAFLTRSLAAQSVGLPGTGFKDDRILVVVQLGGGNDGLNTIVPYADDHYHRLRRNLALKPDTLLRLDDYHAMAPTMEPFKHLYDSGELAVVHGVGYPNPNRSHFRSMEIWHTATDADRYSSTGWIGRYFDNACSGEANPLAGVNIGQQAPQAFGGRRGMGVSFDRPTDFGWAGEGRASRDAFDRLNGTKAKHHEHGSTLDFLRHVTANAVTSSDQVIRASRVSRPAVDYPDSRIGNSLKTIASLIAGGLPTRLYYASMTGFDTHAGQQFSHGGLLGGFAKSVAAFQKDLKAIGVADRVQIICFSEFGRRVAENASRGTDHGTAGPMFLLGSGVKPGMHGTPCRLDDLDDGDLKHTVDFRSIYAEVLEKWLGTESEGILGRRFEGIGVLG
jgi:uncharacterized protein (DUF1501 family)